MIIKHARSMDVGFQINKKRIIENKWVLKGEWINLGYIESFPLGIKETIRIPKTELGNWLTIINCNLKCLRNANWRKLA